MRILFATVCVSYVGIFANKYNEQSVTEEKDVGKCFNEQASELETKPNGS